jgi:putative PIN family toxin of toxin-antitoxin system
MSRKRSGKCAVRLVLDTNILVSSLIRKDTPPYLLYRAWRRQRFVLLSSTHQLTEVEDVLARPRLQKYVSPQEAQEMVRGLRIEAELVDVDLVDVAYSPDPDDNRILVIAIAGQVNYVVSGDRADMLSLGDVEGIAIVTARQAVDILDLRPDA